MADKKNSYIELLKNGILTENPTFIQLIGMCPTLAVTTTVENGIGMGLAATAVLVGSNVIISLLRKLIPEKVRIAAYVVIIAALVTVIEFVMKAYIPALYDSLGLFIPLIVVNCIILARAEAFASKNSVGRSALDGLGMGLGFTCALIILSTIRELIGAGTLLGFAIMPAGYEPVSLIAQSSGGFLVLGFVIALIQYIRRKRRVKTS